MSELIKSENTYHLTDDNARQVGALGWALRQLRKGNKVRRSDWDDAEQLRFVPRKPDAEGQGDYLAHLDKHNKQGNWAPWQPTQEDLMAEDWEQVKEAVKPEPETGDNTLMFDLTTGMFTVRGMQQFPHFYGYTDTMMGYPTIPVTLGTLSITQNTTVIDKIMNIMWEEPKDTQSTLALYWYVQGASSVVSELFKKALQITVEGVTYNLGVPEVSSSKPDDYRFKYVYNVNSELRTEAQKFSALFKQVDQTKRYSCSWN
ncbi:hypothetical protein Xbed_02121 [Xenorhabdus beddingii]|uniref:Uncharacterized protein n=1 Tax=Xenorhabdus beddingii TaxID=40578 RepID=A0A1Y2SNB1_9GAMM|nr:DUF2829 domain-containing protein [Xenorhabdus beddingii]OTA19620.1 hypothetical protein Xbed_02121 [Xenorhabdus beddingii]